MFRITGQLLTIRRLLRRQPIDVQVVQHTLLHKYKPQERETCPTPPAPPPPKPKDDSAFWGTLALVFVAAGFAVIAQRSPEIRDWLTIHAPWFDDFIAIMYEENMTYRDYAEKCIEDVKDYVAKIGTEDKPKNCSLDGKPIITVPQKHEVETKKDGECVIIPPPVITKSICEIEECVKDRAEDALNNYYTAKEACAYYNSVVEEAMQNFTIPTVRKLHGELAERIKLVNTSIANANEALAEFNDLIQYFECGVKAPPEHIANTRGLINDYQQKLTASLMQYEWENDKALAMDMHWQMVENSVDKYTVENQTMYPEIKYEEDKLQLQNDPDFLLYHTFRYASKLRGELDNAVVGMTDRVNRGMETLPENKARDAKLDAVYRQKKADLDREFQKRYADQIANNDKILKDSLKKQLDRHHETLQRRLGEKEKEATITLNKMVAEKVAFEKSIFARQLAEMAGKLKLVEDKLNAHLKAERETRRSQELWVAGSALLAATKKGTPHVDVNKELNAIQKASGDGDKLVETVLKAIPGSVREKGIVPESVLRDRYHRMENLALKVALVEHDGAPLPVYILSWVQSALLFMKISGIPQEEFDKPPKEPFQNLDTFDLLQRARFWMERGNLAAAIRYVSALEGASRAAAATWTEDARAYLETRQAAEAVLAHAAALGLQYI
ncbi:MICOS complex subunit Mic60-like [Pieris rapae]|uniref:MICOS complex subunit Mic60-like n=1 Tax=Pieris rapae TaxID=64459 RepID=UPI001E27A2B1|nr:MICOS complex subunit Mic60-like [Pieris rapae]